MPFLRCVTVSLARLAAGLAVLVLGLFLGAPSVLGQATDAQGLIVSSRWLVLGPFRHTVGCGEAPGDLLQDFLSPTTIQCQYPAAGDEVEYDSFQADSVEYLGPPSQGLLPQWRPFDDGSDDGDQALSLDRGYECRQGNDNTCIDVLSWLVTYVEYFSPAPIQAELCLGASGGAVAWLDGQLVHHRSGCGRRSPCQERVAVTITPGVHRLACASFAGDLDWGLSLGLEVAGEPVIDGTPEWTFHGGTRPDLAPPACPPLASPVRALGCQVDAGTSVGLAWDNPPRAEPAQAISVRIKGQEIVVLPGTATSAVLPASAFPHLGESEVCVVNASGLPACCTVRLLEPVTLSRCFLAPGGEVELAWSNPPGAPVDASISIQVDSSEVARAEGDSTGYTIASDRLPAGFSQVCVINASGVAACCTPEDEGLIPTENWLILGPFLQARVGCDGRERDEHLLLNYIAPSDIRCLYPSEGEPADYDPALAASEEYVGPPGLGGGPHWRPFDDGTPLDGDIDLSMDAGYTGREEALVSWLVTYLEYRGTAPVPATLCIGVDDAGQAWLDDVRVFNKNRCGLREPCEFEAPVIIAPGMHRLAMAAFNGGGAWGFRVGLRVGGEPVREGPGSPWVFHGRARLAGEFPCATGEPEVCGNGADDDGDTRTDCDDLDCAGRPPCVQGGTALRRGDSDVNGVLDISDPINSLSFQFQGSFTPPCLTALDFDDDGTVDIADPIAGLQHLFLGGSGPAPPGSSCGPDPTEDLGCASYGRCP